MNEPTLRVLNLGAGVQSSTLALLASRGEIGPMPDCAIFADTGWERRATYEYLDWLEPHLAFPVHRVKAVAPASKHGGLRQDMVASTREGRFNGVPFFTESVAGGGRLKRQCTTDYKIRPIESKCRELLGVKRVLGQGVVEQWFGISADEIYRVKESPVRWITRRWPLVFELRMTRGDCLRWWDAMGLPHPPRSACIGCPFHSDREWRNIKDTSPVEWADAVEFDRIIRNGVRGTKERCYLHRSLKPLDEVDLSTDEENGQLSLFTEECEGMCGV